MILGKNVPFTWGRSQFIQFEICRAWSLDQVGGTLKADNYYPYHTLEAAVTAYPLYFRDYVEDVRKAKEDPDPWRFRWAVWSLPIIVPEVQFEKALMNPYVRVWDKAKLPLPPNVKAVQSECRAKVVGNVWVIDFPESMHSRWHEHFWEKDTLSELRHLVLPDIFCEMPRSRNVERSVESATSFEDSYLQTERAGSPQPDKIQRR